jgi:dihydrofolate reductase
MGRLVVDMFVTLDGVIQAPGGPDEDTEGGFQYGGWQGPFFDEESGNAITKGIENNDALLLGRKTYDIFAGYWPHQSGVIADKLNAMPKHVASRTLKELEWRNSTLIEGGLAEGVAKLKAKHKEMHTIGSGELARSLLGHDLVDEVNLWQYPVVLGTGKRLFEGAPPMRFKLLEAKRFPGGAVHLRYERAGRPTFMDMAAQPPPDT